jgi:hypothetical protein
VLTAQDRAHLADLAPVLRRAVSLDPRSLVRLRLGGGRAVALVRLPFDVLVSRGVTSDRAADLDVVVAAAQTLDWLDDDGAALPTPRDAEWRSGSPPVRGWTRLDTVPDDVVRRLVRQGSETLQQAADREGVPGAQPRAEVTDALLDSVVLQVEDAGASAQVTLRALSALLRMGFLPAGGRVHVDTVGRWVRVVAEYGTVYLERPGARLTVG